MNTLSPDLTSPEHPEMAVAYVPTTSLQPYARNARTHKKGQVKMIAESIKAFGFTNPILTDQNNTIVAGHGRLEAAKLIGMPKVPTIRLENLTPDQIRAYILADNKLAEKAGWDDSILAIELQHLLTVDLGFEVTVTGFEVPEIDLLVGHATTAPDPEDQLEPAASGPPVSQPGDLWLLGKHRILCADALQESSFANLMEGRKADAVFVDPLYCIAGRKTLAKQLGKRWRPSSSWISLIAVCQTPSSVGECRSPTK